MKMPSCCESSETNDQEKALKSIRAKFAWYSFGVFLTFSAYTSMLNLQSSINIEEGLGTIAAATTYGTAVIFGLLCTPVLVRRFGAKNCMVACDFNYMIYVISNLYPEFYTLVPAAVIVGIGESTMWTSFSMMNIYFATQYHATKNEDKKTLDHYINLFSGYFFMIIQFTQIFGNLLAYVVLYAFNKQPRNMTSSASFENSSKATWTSTKGTTDVYQFCGSNDCQDAEIVNETLDQYSPTSKLTLYILIGVFVAMCICCQIIHIFLVPDPRNSPKEDNQTIKHGLGNGEDQKSQTTSNVKEDLNSLDNARDTNTKSDKENSQENGDSGFLSLLKRTLIDVGKYLIVPHNLLLMPLPLYEGFLMAFVFSELTRGFSSCVLGYAMIGLHMSLFGLGHSISPFIVGKFGKRIGRKILFGIAALLDVCVYLYCLLWNPNVEESWTIFLAFFCIGFSDGIWQPGINVMYIEFFPNNQEVALTMWNLCIILGLTIQFSWSTTFCIYTKIYIQFALLAVGLICCSFASYLHSKMRTPNDEKQGTQF